MPYYHTFQLSIQVSQSCGYNFLHSSSLCPGAVRGETVAPDAAASSDARGEDIVWVKVITSLDIFRVEVSLVFVVLIRKR